MDLKSFIKWLQAEMKQVNQESYHKMNYKKELIFPYLTYQIHTDKVLDFDTRTIIDVEIDMFDEGKTNIKLLDLESQLSNNFDRKIFKLEDKIVRVRVGSCNDIPTVIENIQRRNLTIRFTVDWI